jgi:hypothetical protein
MLKTIDEVSLNHINPTLWLHYLSLYHREEASPLLHYDVSKSSINVSRDGLYEL